MKQHDDTWATFALTGDPTAYLEYKQQRKTKLLYEKENSIEAN